MCDSAKFCCSTDVTFGWMTWIKHNNLKSIDEIIRILNEIDQINIYKATNITMIISHIDESFDIDLDDRIESSIISTNTSIITKRKLPPILISAEWIRCRVLWIDNKTLELISFVFRPSTKLSELNSFDWTNVIVAERIVGSMVQVFWWQNDWYINTLQRVFPICTESPKLQIQEWFIQALHNLEYDFDDLNRNIIYTFIVTPPHNISQLPKITLTGVMTRNFNNDTHQCTQFTIKDINYIPIPFDKPRTYKFANYYKLLDWLETENFRRSYINGILIICGFKIWKFDYLTYEHFSYMIVKYPKTAQLYLCLRRFKHINAFLQRYPDYDQIFNKYRNYFHQQTSQIYTYYRMRFIDKSIRTADIPTQYRQILNLLNYQYINVLRNKGEIITFNYVKQFINEMNISDQMQILETIENDEIVSSGAG